MVRNIKTAAEKQHKEKQRVISLSAFSTFVQVHRDLLEYAEKECWVYLEVNTDDFIREDDIKTMKSLKNDILSIMPIYPSVENDNQVIEPNKDIPLEMMVENYYKKKIGAEMSEETKSVLMDILGEDKEDK